MIGKNRSFANAAIIVSLINSPILNLRIFFGVRSGAFDCCDLPSRMKDLGNQFLIKTGCCCRIVVASFPLVVKPIMSWMQHKKIIALYIAVQHVGQVLHKSSLHSSRIQQTLASTSSMSPLTPKNPPIPSNHTDNPWCTFFLATLARFTTRSKALRPVISLVRRAGDEKTPTSSHPQPKRTAQHLKQKYSFEKLTWKLKSCFKRPLFLRLVHCIFFFSGVAAAKTNQTQLLLASPHCTQETGAA